MEEKQNNKSLQTQLYYWGNTPTEQDYYNLQGIKSTKSFFTSPRNLTLFTRSWLPSAKTPPRGIIFMVHGYGNDISWTFQATPIQLAKNGFACFALDLEGHGQSQDKVRPRWPIPQFLTILAKFAPTLAIVPTADLLDKSVKVPEKKIIGGMNPNRYVGKPRLGTVLELLRVTDYVSSKLCDVNLPFLILHGSADVVTDPEVSRELYQLAKSKDKTLKIYEGMMHSLLFGETDENVEIVRSDILAWLNDRC
ncbi:PREDICTED: caffeoylshikimate esterase isoform X2 [Nicotiana attenuata]|uniref:caffeoylshikimate esterase isoform X2 n=1 Tax=Nicotiana attenuata TaxID=49451 RepID=UPI000904C02F|nr:PREDICTED: caffeoylshikimate esterase isoform X2 [Nicotiana attenuata]